MAHFDAESTSSATRKRRCWAESLGDCSGPLSAEHLVGDAVFEATKLEVFGVDKITQGQHSKTVGKSSLTARVLCRHHNSALSPLDEEVTALHKAIREARRTVMPVIHRVNGELLERWHLRVLTNLLAAGWSSPHVRGPGDGIVRQVFGLAPIVAPSGLYAVSGYQGSIPPDSISWHVVQAHESVPQVLGILVSLSGLLLCLSMCKFDLQPILHDGGFEQFDLSRTRTHYHPLIISLGNRNAQVPTPSLRLDFNW